MEIKIDIPDYDIHTGLKCEWENGFEIETKLEDGNFVLCANRAGLISLAKHLLLLSQDQVPIGHHIHLDEFNSLGEKSVGIIIQKI